MKAAVCYEFGKPLVVEEIEINQPQMGEVLVKTSPVGGRLYHSTHKTRAGC